MKEIRDKRKLLACKGDTETGRLDCMYSGYCVKISLAIGQTAAIQRDDCVTFVTRTENDFSVNALQVA